MFKFATDVSVDQTTEIARMEKMLSASVQARAEPASSDHYPARRNSA